MGRDRFEIWRRRGAVSGQARLSDTIRGLLYRADEPLFGRLAFDDDTIFLDPTLFAFMTDPSQTVDLRQLLYGRLPIEDRSVSLRLVTDGAGCACLGSFASVETHHAGAELTFVHQPDGTYCCHAADEPIPFRMRVPLVMPGTTIEVATSLHPLFRRFFDGSEPDMQDTRAPDRCLPSLLIALDLIRAYCPPLWAEIHSFVRLIVLYRAVTPNSFAAKSAHGAIFCNVADDDGEIALLEDIAHQSAHVIFNAFSHDPVKLILLDPETPVGTLCDTAADRRPVNAAFHALFTYTFICRALAGVIEARVLGERQTHELLARLGSTFRKFDYDLRVVDLPHIYSLAGRRCYAAFADEYGRFRARYGSLVAAFDYGNQPYAFDYARFVERNGGPWPIIGEMAS